MEDSDLRIYSLRFSNRKPGFLTRVESLRLCFRVKGLGFRVKSLGLKIQGLWIAYNGSGSGFEVKGMV